MIDPVTSSSAAAQASAQTRTPAHVTPKPASPPQDKVELSSKAQSSGDVDHDGDSH